MCRLLTTLSWELNMNYRPFSLALGPSGYSASITIKKRDTHPYKQRQKTKMKTTDQHLGKLGQVKKGGEGWGSEK